MKLAYSFAFTSLLLVNTALAAPKDYDGAWNAVVSYGLSIYNEAPFSYERRIVITDGSFAFTRERMLWNNHFNTTVRYTDHFTGRVENGVMAIAGKDRQIEIDILPGATISPGRPWPIRPSTSRAASCRMVQLGVLQLQNPDLHLR